MPTCPLHKIPMFHVGRVPTWQDRSQQAEAWHCPKCSIEIQLPITPETAKPTKAQPTP